MNTPEATLPRLQSRGEEIANSVSHGVTLLAALAAVPVLMVFAASDGGGARIVGASVFGVALVLLYLSSTLYHALPHGRAKRVFHVLDHSAIYVLIAGTYTPFTLGVLAGGWGWTLFALVWGLAGIGVTLKAYGRARHQMFSLGPVVAGRGRCRLHRRGRLLRARRARALRALRLAPVRAHRQCVPLRRGAALRGLICAPRKAHGVCASGEPPDPFRWRGRPRPGAMYGDARTGGDGNC